MINDIIQNSEIRMEKCVQAFKVQIQKIHTGRISPNILDNIKIKYPEKTTVAPIRYLANIINENPYTLIITAFDPNIITIIEKTIIQSDLNLNINSNGNNIRVSLPTLTEERRHHLIKLVHHEAEKIKISIRSIRRSINDQIKILMKNKTISEDQEHDLQNKIQKCTNTWIKTIEILLKNKTSELKNF